MQRFASEIWPHVEKFFIAGPTLIGFIIGLVKYPPRSAAFEVAFQSLLIFCGYLVALIFVQAIDTLFLGNVPLFLAVARSLFALAYIALTLLQYLPWRAGEPRMFAFTRKFRERFSALGDAH